MTRDAIEQAGATILDLVGLRCPLPVLKSRRALARLAPGDRLIVSTSDPLATVDLPHMCAEDGHVLVEVRRDGDRAVFVIDRGADRPAQEKRPEKPEI
ncbi:sulfurtransferase TusA family protein [Siculibacillus lacustris]|uniref:Sulfurtransferase TusA family protein n=1 Tax=Siculibacillus lacustris TaxID=1549641 RepID=A0A4Q9VCA3_9HYPH|nr:sulfurtransferase TusA family protein [Siculibacillus lacustris]TBW31940.1 sulfurtransferase TusA family protein [Siculibacillus lacustris]